MILLSSFNDGLSDIMKAYLICALGVIFLAVGCASVPGDAIKVGTYNIRYSGVNGSADRGTPNAWVERKGDLLALVSRLDLDVFGLQEVCPDQAKFLRDNLPEYEFVGEHRNADRVSDEASPVCYRKSRFDLLAKGTFWLSETPDIPGRRGWGAGCPRVCSYLVLRDRISGKRFCFANTHTDHVSELARKNGMLLVIERMKKIGDGIPVVFTGDHNCLETDAPAKAVAAILRDALYESETTPRGSWRSASGWKWLDYEVSISEALDATVDERNSRDESLSGIDAYGKYGMRIDYIYVSPDVRVLDYETINDARPGKKLYPSDHFPVVATIEL